MIAVPTRGVLSWTEPADPRERLLAAQEERFQAVLTSFVRAGVGARLRSLAGALTDAGRARLLLAPETVRRLAFGPRTELGFFLTAVRAELCRLDPAAAVGEPVWSALGDWRCTAHCAPYEAPRLSNGLPVDHLSPWAGTAAAWWSGATVPYGPDGCAALVAKLDAALELIRRAGAGVDAFVAAHARVVVARRDLADERTFVSFSTGQTPGRLGFVNAHSARLDVPETADKLVHESVHQFLYLAEQERPTLRRGAAADRSTVASPWTGRPVQVHSFVHACQVWFALWMFWRRLAGTTAVAQRVAELAGRARRGFDDPRMGAALATAAEFLTPAGAEWAALVDDVRRGCYD